ncbi:hypothetical protein O1M54_06180 [Streptomyces diastatochromogenes]|nr:hypothetical protein [Streptomyces diastatochromogenes]
MIRHGEWAPRCDAYLRAVTSPGTNRRKIRKWLDTLALGGERPRRRTATLEAA